MRVFFVSEGAVVTKYDGMRKVDISVTRSDAVDKRKAAKGDLFIRTVAAVLLAAVPLTLKAVPKAEKAVSVIKSAITYDYVEKEERSGAEFAAIELIKEQSAEKEE